MSVNFPFQLLMPSYNQARYIGDAVRSILAQDDPHWELRILDNSSDGTPELLRGFTDPRIHFQHVPERMDPGSCLNLLLSQAGHNSFSYVHTDNNLHPSYVRQMRAALHERLLGLAHCDMRLIDDNGRYLGIFRRGAFDLPRMLSLDTLGVPFAATAELARRVGGFSAADFADDVRFCVGAYGLAEYVHVRAPLVDYRLHAGSRTEGAGGSPQMQRIFTRLMPKIATVLEQRGLRPVDSLDHAINDNFDDLDLFVEDRWYRYGSKITRPWWRGCVQADQFFFAGLLDVPGFTAKTVRPPWRPFIRDDTGRIIVFPWTKWRLRRHMRRHRKEFRRHLHAIHNMLPIWACIKLGSDADTPIPFRVGGTDFRTLWIARSLETLLGWAPKWDKTVKHPPQWLPWGKAEGDEPLLDWSTQAVLAPSTKAGSPSTRGGTI